MICKCVYVFLYMLYHPCIVCSCYHPDAYIFIGSVEMWTSIKLQHYRASWCVAQYQIARKMTPINALPLVWYGSWLWEWSRFQDSRNALYWKKNMVNVRRAAKAPMNPSGKFHDMFPSTGWLSVCGWKIFVLNVDECVAFVSYRQRVEIIRLCLIRIYIHEYKLITRLKIGR